jgi:hypothetical protein
MCASEKSQWFTEIGRSKKSELYLCLGGREEAHAIETTGRF